MKILLLDTYPVRRGSQVFFEELAESFIAKGITIKKVYLYRYDSDVKIHLNPQDVVLNGEQNNIFEKFPTVQPSLLKRLISIVNEFEPEVIILNGSRTLKYASIGKYFFKNKPKLIYRIIDSVVFWNPSSLKQLYYRHFILRNIDAAIGVSEASLNDVKKLYRFKKSSTVIHRCFNANTINFKDNVLMNKLMKEKEGKMIILFLGNLTKQKRPERFVETIRLLTGQYPNCYGWIVGDGVLRNEVENKVAELGLNNRITFWGYQKNVFPFISNSDVLLLTSDTEGLPGVTLEAGYLKVPTVCPNVGGVKEFILNDDIGFVLDSYQPKEFAKALSELIDNPTLRASMGEKARARVEEAFDMKVISKQYLDFISSVIN